MFSPGEWDGAGAVVKRALRAEQIRNPGRQLQNARHVVDFLTEHLSSRVPSSYAQSTTKDISRCFWHVGENDVLRSNLYNCRTLPGSSKLHSVCGFSRIDPTQLMIRQLLCFCNACIDSEWDNCENKAHVQNWSVVKLRPTNAQAVQDQIQENNDPGAWQFGGVNEELGDLVAVIDNFAVPTPENNQEGVSFYVL
jgi:hypothetical protein